MSTASIAAICLTGGLVHLAGGRYVWRQGYRIAGGCYVLTGVVMLAFAASLLRNGAPGG